MNIKEITLDEIELQSSFIEEGISALLHTILFVRAPNQVKPEDYICQRLAPLTFARCGSSDVDKAVKDALELLDKTRTPVGPNLSKSIVLLTFFEKREIKGFFGLLSNQEKVCFERWKIPVVVNEHPIPSKSNHREHMDYDSINFERQHIFDHARNQVQARILTILETANGSVDHVPPTLYEYELQASAANDRGVGGSLVSRLINSPMI